MQEVGEIAAPRHDVIDLGAARRHWGEKLVKLALLLCALVSVATTAGIVFSVIEPSIEFFLKVPLLDYITGTDWAPLFTPPSFGVLPLVTGTLVVTTVASLVALPVGLSAAIYLSEYARSKTRKSLKPALEVLAGIPTVVYGYFTLKFVTPLLRDLFPFLGIEQFNGLAAGIVMGVMIIPTVSSLSEDAMSAVPRSLREGAYGLGATKMKVSTRVVVPAALSGIVAAFVLGVSRAIGETMIVLIAAGGEPALTLNPARAMETMTAFIAAAGQGDLSTGSIGYKSIFVVGGTLFAATFILNMLSIRFVRRYREVYE